MTGQDARQLRAAARELVDVALTIQDAADRKSVV